MAKNYHPQDIEKKWRQAWEEKKTFQPDMKASKKPFYNLMMFPYPSAEGLHVGNMYAFTGADIYGRFQRMKGFDVFEPIGLDGFGIHSENYALKIGEHPARLAKKTERRFYDQLHQTGNGYAWDNTLETYDPDYYRWTQWIFIQLFKAGLVERRRASVNWCPSCKTTLSDEQVISGKCERCQEEVEKKDLEQWFFKITKYAEKLLKNLDWIDWSERTKTAQRNWIGRSEGLEEEWQVEGMDLKLKTFTTWPHTTWGATFMVIAPEHPIIKKLVKGTKYEKGARAFAQKAIKNKIEDPLNIEKNKEGFFIGQHVINPLNGRRMPLYIANFAIYEYGTGIVKCTPTHDQRDFEFAKKYNLDFVPVIYPKIGQPLDPKKMEKVYIGEGLMMNAKQFNGMSTEKARKAIGDYSVKQGHGRWTKNYRLRDWCISRQRYWGPPIPMIYCQKCGWQSVPEKDLPVKLPELEDYQPKGSGESPLAQAKDWLKTTCPKCKGEAKRETDVSDTFLDSAWYFFRYPNTDLKDKPFSKETIKKWLPVNMYIGGQEHAVLHLMYTRFLTMVFKDLGLIEFEEPFKRFYAHGLIISEGAKMSKSKGNVVIPDKYIKKFGADTLRCYLMFLGPFDQGGDFRSDGISGMYRFLDRAWRLVIEAKKTTKANSNLNQIQHQTIQKVTKDISKLRYNTAIAGLMEYINELTKQKKVSKQALETLVLLIAPFAPFMAEELWCEVLGNKFSVHHQPWPKHDPKLIKTEKTVIIIQVNGKLRGQVEVTATQAKNKPNVIALAKKEANVSKYLEEKKIKKTIFVPEKLINFVI